MNRFLRRVVLLLCIVSLGGGGICQARDFEAKKDGMYAVISTSRGVMVAELYFRRVPKTVANFVGLAEGTREWYDLEEGRLVKRPFYDWVEFHRIVPGVLVQTGSRNGKGNDGPGYWFSNEIDETLSHRRSGILSMANRGSNSNGSQFFITLKSMRHLDGKHSVFGRIFRGESVLSSIGSVRLNGTKPRKPVYIEHIKIVRTGEDAKAFDCSMYHSTTASRESVLFKAQ